MVQLAGKANLNKLPAPAKHPSVVRRKREMTTTHASAGCSNSDGCRARGVSVGRDAETLVLIVNLAL